MNLVVYRPDIDPQNEKRVVFVNLDHSDRRKAAIALRSG
jgi:hypothetical protein